MNAHKHKCDLFNFQVDNDIGQWTGDFIVYYCLCTKFKIHNLKNY